MVGKNACFQLTPGGGILPLQAGSDLSDMKLAELLRGVKLQRDLHRPMLAHQVARFFANLDFVRVCITSAILDGMVVDSSRIKVLLNLDPIHAHAEVMLKRCQCCTVGGLSSGLRDLGIHEPSRNKYYPNKSDSNDFPHLQHSTVWPRLAVVVVLSP